MSGKTQGAQATKKGPGDPAAPENGAKKKGGFNFVLLLIPIAIVAALVLAFTLPPTHAMLVNGPLKPLLARFGMKSTSDDVAAKAKPTADPAADVKRLSDELEAQKRDAAAKDTHIAALQSQVNQLQASPSPTPAAKASAAPVSESVKRVATYWAGMDADKAAEIVAQLPDRYVNVVFSQMPADSVADIIGALPAKRAARLTADTAQAR